MDNLTQEQARALFEAGGFVVISDLPQGSEFGIDGHFYVTRKFSGFKFLPPGLHLITWSPPASAASGPSTIPLRSALLRLTRRQERLILSYDKASEAIHSTDEEGIISSDRLKSLDSELALYPLNDLDRWKGLTSHITPDILRQVLGEEGRTDGMMEVEGEEEDLKLEAGAPDGVPSLSARPRKKLQFPKFDLRRSWRPGAVGEEITRYSRDKSWLMGHVLDELLGGDSHKLVGYLQLSFILLLYLSSYSALLVYKRFLTLLTRSSSILQSPKSGAKPPGRGDIASVYALMLGALSAQLAALPDGVFETELPEMDLFYLDELGYLREHLRDAMSELSDTDRNSIESAWRRLQRVAQRWDWRVPDLRSMETTGEEDDETEEGEYAPVIVET